MKMRQRKRAFGLHGFTTIGRLRHQDVKFYSGARWTKREMRQIRQRQVGAVEFNVIAPYAPRMRDGSPADPERFGVIVFDAVHPMPPNVELSGAHADRGQQSGRLPASARTQG